MRFEIEDCCSEWTYPRSTFDYVHMRYLVGSIVDWTALYKEAFAALKPGGWLESFEGSPHMVSDDGTVPERSAISQWGKFFEEGGRAMGRTFMVVQEGVQKKAMEEAGFVDIQEWDFKVRTRPSFFLRLILATYQMADGIIPPPLSPPWIGHSRKKGGGKEAGSSSRLRVDIHNH